MRGQEAEPDVGGQSVTPHSNRTVKAHRLIRENRVMVWFQNADVVCADVLGDSGEYTVTLDPAGGFCSCPNRQRTCSHLAAVALLIQIPQATPTQG